MTKNVSVFAKKADLSERLFNILHISKGTYLSKDPVLDLFNPDLYLSNLPVKNGRNLRNNKKTTLSKLLSSPVDGIEDILDATANILGFHKDTKEIKDYHAESKSQVSKSAKKVYSTFVNYASKSYEAVKTNIKKWVGNVRYTVFKFANISLFVKSALNPQWNFAVFSALDKDTPTMTLTSNTSLDADQVEKYEAGGQYLAYHH